MTFTVKKKTNEHLKRKNKIETFYEICLSFLRKNFLFIKTLEILWMSNIEYDIELEIES